LTNSKRTPRRIAVPNAAIAEIERLQSVNAELLKKALVMRDAIDAMDLALHDDPLWDKTFDRWDGARDDIKIYISMSLEDLRQIHAARAECNRIANAPEFTPSAIELRGSRRTQ
jgi:hypothetical protein